MGFLNSDSFSPCNLSYAEIQAFNSLSEISQTTLSSSKWGKTHTAKLPQMSGFPVQGSRKGKSLERKPANVQAQGVGSLHSRNHERKEPQMPKLSQTSYAQDPPYLRNVANDLRKHIEGKL